MYSQKPPTPSWAWSQDSPESRSTGTAQLAGAEPSSFHPRGIQDTASEIANIYSPTGRSMRGTGPEQMASPSHGSNHAAPAVSITINGSFVCHSPQRQQPAVQQASDVQVQQQQGAGLTLDHGSSIDQQQRAHQLHYEQQWLSQDPQHQQPQASQALDHEASLAHLYQTQPVEAQHSSQPIAMSDLKLTNSRSHAAQPSHRVGQLQAGMDRAQSDATSREAMGAAAQLESPGLSQMGARGSSDTAAATQQSRSEGSWSVTTAAPADTIDTAALQQEVSQLRQQVLLWILLPLLGGLCCCIKVAVADTSSCTPCV